MAREITIFGPLEGQKLVLFFQQEYVELRLALLVDHFHLQGKAFSLKPLSLNIEQCKLEPIQLSDNAEGFLLDSAANHLYRVCIDEATGKDKTILHGLGDEGCEEELYVHHNVHGMASGSGSNIEPSSVFDLIKAMPLNSSLHAAMQSVKDFRKLLELPRCYDGYVAFELPPCASKSSMIGMEQKNDSHDWIEYVTSTYDCFEGVVHFSRCSGHLRCISLDCSYYMRLGFHNET